MKRAARRPLLVRIGRTLAIFSFTLLVIMLPALAGGTRLDEPAHADELARIRAVLARSPAEGALPGSIPGHLFLRATVPFATRDLGSKSLDDPKEREQVVTYARFVNLLGLLLLSCCMYLVLADARGRATALLSCLALTLLPAIAREGHVLRPEVPAAACSALALAVLLAALVLDRPLRQVPELKRFAVMTALFLGSGALCGLAATFQQRAAILVLLPAGVLVLVTASLTLVLARLVRRKPEVPIPLRAMSLRFLSWMLAMLLWLWLCAVVIRFGYEAGAGVQPSSRSEVGLLPASWLLRAPLLLLALLGGVRLIWSAGKRVSHGARVGGETVLVVFAALLFVQHQQNEPGSDALMAAVPLAMLVGEGLASVVLGLLRTLLRTRRALT